MMPAMRVPRWMTHAVPLAVLVCAGSNKLGGDLKVDGKAFSPKSCRNGQVFGFAGVEVTGADGRRMRVIHTPTGEAQVVLFAAGSPTGVDLGKCGTVSVSDQNSTVNN